MSAMPLTRLISGPRMTTLPFSDWLPPNSFRDLPSFSSYKLVILPHRAAPPECAGRRHERMGAEKVLTPVGHVKEKNMKTKVNVCSAFALVSCESPMRPRSTNQTASRSANARTSVRLHLLRYPHPHSAP